MLRHGLRARVEQEAELPVVGGAENGAQLRAQLLATPCDGVLLDLPMPGLNGLVTSQRLRAEFPEVRVLIRSLNDHALAIRQVIAASAQGYGLKNASPDEILVGVRIVRLVSACCAPNWASRCWARCSPPKRRPPPSLPAREQNISSL